MLGVFYAPVVHILVKGGAQLLVKKVGNIGAVGVLHPCKVVKFECGVKVNLLLDESSLQSHREIVLAVQGVGVDRLFNGLTVFFHRKCRGFQLGNIQNSRTIPVSQSC